MTKLDTRPVRLLTSREIASILCGAVAPPLSAGLRDQVGDVLRTSLDMDAAIARVAEATGGSKVAAISLSLLAAASNPSWVTMLSAVIGACRANHERATLDALRWMLAHLDDLAGDALSRVPQGAKA